MNRKCVRTMAGIVGAISIFSAVPAMAVNINTYSENLSVYYNDVNVYENSDNKPIIINDRAMVQIKPIFELMGFSSEYNDINKTATFTSADNSLKYAFIAEDANIYKLGDNGEKQSVRDLDVPTTIYNDTFYVPLRGFCDVFNMNIAWENSTRSVKVSGNDTKTGELSFSNFVGEWGNISGLYLAQHVDVNMDILSVDEINKTITLKYKYDMVASGVWSGGSVDYGDTVTVPYTEKVVKIEVKSDEYRHDYEEFNSLVTDPIEIIGNNKMVSSIIGYKDEALFKVRLVVPGNGNMYSTVSNADYFSCSKSDICEKLN